MKRLAIEPTDSPERKLFKNKYNTYSYLLMDLIRDLYFSEFFDEDFFSEIIIKDNRADHIHKNREVLLTISLTNHK